MLQVQVLLKTMGIPYDLRTGEEGSAIFPGEITFDFRRLWIPPEGSHYHLLRRSTRTMLSWGDDEVRSIGFSSEVILEYKIIP